MSLRDRITALTRLQGSAYEDYLVHEDVIVYDAHRTANPGTSVTMRAHLESGRDAFHKPLRGINATLAAAYGQRPEEPPIHECLAWRVAFTLGDPYRELIAACVMRQIDGEFGSLSARAVGSPDLPAAIREVPDECSAAAFFDALIGQQDRHGGNLRWDADAGQLRLFDHGFTFKRPNDLLINSAILRWRLHHASAGLGEDELSCLERVLNGELDQLLAILDADRAEALRARAEHMLGHLTLIAP